MGWAAAASLAQRAAAPVLVVRGADAEERARRTVRGLHAIEPARRRRARGLAERQLMDTLLALFLFTLGWAVVERVVRAIR